MIKNPAILNVDGASRHGRRSHINRAKSSRRCVSTPRFQMEAAPPQRKDNTPAPRMRVLLRNAKTMKYVSPGERWTADPNQATDFHNGWGAAEHAASMPLRHLVIHYEFEDTRYNLNIPIRSSPAH